jgi:signal transduction histidine kinase/ActR/RegA family two-component response regulator
VKTSDRSVATLRRLFLHRSVPYGVFAIGCALSVAAYSYLSNAAVEAAEIRARSQFIADAQQMRRQIQTGVSSYIEVARATAVLLSSENEINGFEFGRYVRRLELKERYPAIEGIGFAQCIDARDVARVLRSLALDGTPRTIWPDTAGSRRCPVLFFDAGDGSGSRMLGFDLDADPRLSAAMHEARDSGEPALARSSALPAEVGGGDERGKLFVFIPVYRSPAPRDVAARRRALVGFVFSPLDAARLFNHVVQVTMPSVTYEVFEGALAAPATSLGGHPATSPVSYQSLERVDVGGHQWLVNVSLLAHDTTMVPEEAERALFAGLLVSFMLFLVTRAQARAWEIAARHEADLRSSAEALKEREAQAHAANRAKDEFLATLSHELRTPLNVVLGWVGMLRHGVLSQERAADALEIIERNARQQAALIDDLLDVSRIITGKLRLNQRLLELGPLVTSVADALRPGADAKGVTLQVAEAPSPSTVMGDPDRLRQAIWNLLANAVKFTPGGGRVSVTLERAEHHLTLRIRDTGIGIAPEFIPRVFERFAQADSTTTRAHSGVGLGLAIVRELVELHGGSVRAHSDGPDRGAEFVITVPNAVAAPELPTPLSSAATDAPRLDGVRVLLIDDDPNTLEMLIEALRTSGAEVSAASSARDALETLQEAQPHVIVSDIAMPGEDGLWLIKRIRQLSAPAGATPAIALTALARKEDRTRAIEAGFQMHLAKPVRVADLQTVVAALAAEQT